MRQSQRKKHLTIQVIVTPAHDPKAGEKGPEAHQGTYAENRHFLYFSGPWQKCLKWLQVGPEVVPYKSRPRQHFVTRI